MCTSGGREEETHGEKVGAGEGDSTRSRRHLKERGLVHKPMMLLRL